MNEQMREAVSQVFELYRKNKPTPFIHWVRYVSNNYGLTMGELLIECNRSRQEYKQQKQKEAERITNAGNRLRDPYNNKTPYWVK